MRMKQGVFTFLLSFALIYPELAAGGIIPKSDKPPQGVSYRVYVYDGGTHVALQLARVILRTGTTDVLTQVTSANGYAAFRDVDPGSYQLAVHMIGYADAALNVVVSTSHGQDSVALTESAFEEAGVTVTAYREHNPTTIDVKSAAQIFNAEDYHAPPTARMTNIVQENATGAVRAPTGEVHIRGHHGEFTYYVDGIPVPLGVFGGLNEVVDPKVIDRATFYTGGFPAEYGGQTAAIIDIQNRVPTGRFHLDFSTYAGSYLVFNGAGIASSGKIVPSGPSSSAAGDTLGGRVGPFRALNSNGQTLSLSNHVGNFGYFVSASRQETDRRIDTPTPVLFNDQGTDYFYYGKFEYILNDASYITSNINFGRTDTQVPFDEVEQGYSPDEQKTSNSFQTLSYYRTLSSMEDHESNLFIGAFAREGTLDYLPSLESPVNFTFAGDSVMYALTEDRTFTTVGVRAKYDVRISHQLLFAAGLLASSTSGTEDFTSRDSVGNAGPASNTSFNGSDVGIFGEGEWYPAEWTRIDFGLRYDAHKTPDTTETQVSPRIRFNFFPDAVSSVYLYYGRLFMPNNLEGLRQLASNVSAGGVATLAERDDYYEIGYARALGSGVRSKVSLYYEFASPGVDDETLGSSAVKTPVNIAEVHTTGLELSLSYDHPVQPISAYANIALIHAYGSGAITGGFLPPDDDGTATDLDHDQRLSIVAGLNYHPAYWFGSLTAIYGSGLTNGDPSGAPFETGLFAFNQAAHVDPSIIFDVSAGRTFSLGGGETLELSLFITNLLDNDYLLKGAYFSAASFGERRNVIFKAAIHI